ncbi:hypothetical protein A359_08260 [secondary endosymbiont of Ctenarytaina eucalypti]|uniref:Uncharacterized protein n=2 Tax=secondary endosymbiont of Ctenarytaina eucalypti TaxID=1199245 RepID=J3TFV3_9ENTR|nr:hypothetical protein A359_08260 [secondary endosymbiont of Ctenarytaina eucalypti]
MYVHWVRAYFQGCCLYPDVGIEHIKWFIEHAIAEDTFDVLRKVWGVASCRARVICETRPSMDRDNCTLDLFIKPACDIRIAFPLTLCSIKPRILISLLIN